MTRPFLFLSCPYSSTDPAVIDARVKAFSAVAAQIEREGRYHASGALFNQMLLDRGEQLPNDFQFWESYSYSALDMSARVGAILLPGWRVSTGVGKELDRARDRGIPIDWYHPFNEDLSVEMRLILREHGAHPNHS